MVWDHSKQVCQHIISNCTTKLSTSCLCESPRSQASTISTPSLFHSSICPLWPQCCRLSNLKAPNVHIEILWNEQFHLNRRPFLPGPRGREFDGTFWTDGVGVSILKRVAGTEKGAGSGKKNTREPNDKIEIKNLSLISTRSPEKNLRNTKMLSLLIPIDVAMLFMMHEHSLRSSPRILRYTSMSRRGHLHRSENQSRLRTTIH